MSNDHDDDNNNSNDICSSGHIHYTESCANALDLCVKTLKWLMRRFLLLYTELRNQNQNRKERKLDHTFEQSKEFTKPNTYILYREFLRATADLSTSFGWQ